jgi:S-formylglutathione hydrolase FrmB
MAAESALAIAISRTVASANTASWAEGPELRSYNAAIGDSSISGISSGAFMAFNLAVPDPDNLSLNEIRAVLGRP